MAADARDLESFVQDALTRGCARELVKAALSTFAEVDFPVPAPRPHFRLKMGLIA